MGTPLQSRQLVWLALTISGFWLASACSSDDTAPLPADNEGGNDGAGEGGALATSGAAGTSHGGAPQAGGTGEAGATPAAAGEAAGGAGGAGGAGAGGQAPLGGNAAGGEGGAPGGGPPDLIVQSGGPWPDSLTAMCSSPTQLIPCPQRDDAFFGQDGTYRINVPSYTQTADTMTDAVTGLVWQRAGVSDKAQAEAVSYCDGLSLGGFDDWRLPTRLEFVSVLDEGFGSGSALPPALTGGALGAYWTASPTGTTANAFFSVNDEFGAFTVSIDTTLLGARCVRGTPWSGSLEVGTDTVVDGMTELEWHLASVAEDAQTWEQALTLCEGLELAGHDDWRLPNIKELLTIVDETATMAPVVDSASFGEVAASRYWSSTPGISFSNERVALTLETEFGSTPAVKMTDLSSVRCVRSAD